MAAIIDHSVDGAAATQRATLRDSDRATVNAGAVFGVEAPSHGRVIDDLRKAGGNVDKRMLSGGPASSTQTVC